MGWRREDKGMGLGSDCYRECLMGQRGHEITIVLPSDSLEDLLSLPSLPVCHHGQGPGDWPQLHSDPLALASFLCNARQALCLKDPERDSLCHHWELTSHHPGPSIDLSAKLSNTGLDWSSPGFLPCLDESFGLSYETSWLLMLSSSFVPNPTGQFFLKFLL